MRLIDADKILYHYKPNTSNTGGDNSMFYVEPEDIEQVPEIGAADIVKWIEEQKVAWDEMSEREKIAWIREGKGLPPI